MRIVVFGASGMIGQGVVRECLAAPDVEAVTCVGAPTKQLGTREINALARG